VGKLSRSINNLSLATAMFRLSKQASGWSEFWQNTPPDPVSGVKFQCNTENQIEMRWRPLKQPSWEYWGVTMLRVRISLARISHEEGSMRKEEAA
tara:strand:+ start:23789 stop:24073 length:285 start_codon:yes stop_codon:yes gene_type:complete